MTIAVLRIRGQVNLKKEIVETLFRLRLRKKLTCVFIDEKDSVAMGMLEAVKDFVAYGPIDKKLEDLIIEKRGQKDPKGVFRGFCRMHPPIGGFKKTTKKAYPRGVLGNNKEIAKLLEKMI